MWTLLSAIILFGLFMYLLRKGIIRTLFSKVISFIFIIILLGCIMTYNLFIIGNTNLMFNTALKYYNKETIKVARLLYKDGEDITFNTRLKEFEIKVNDEWYPMTEVKYKKVNKDTFILVDNKEYKVVNKNLEIFLEEVYK